MNLGWFYFLSMATTMSITLVLALYKVSMNSEEKALILNVKKVFNITKK